MDTDTLAAEAKEAAEEEKKDCTERIHEQSRKDFVNHYDEHCEKINNFNKLFEEM